MKTFILIAALAAPLATVAAPAAAQDNTDVRQTVLRYSDLDLTRSAGAQAMMSRIRQAAETVCGKAPLTRELGERADHTACMATTMGATVKKVDAPLVTALYGASDRPTALARK